jgi:hypothetical protein
VFVFATVTDEVEAWQRIFGGGPLAAFIGVLILASITLFVLLIRAKNAHLQTAIAVTPIAQKLEETVNKVVSGLESTTRVLERAIDIMEAMRGNAEGRNRAHSSEPEAAPHELTNPETSRGGRNDAG